MAIINYKSIYTDLKSSDAVFSQSDLNTRSAFFSNAAGRWKKVGRKTGEKTEHITISLLFSKAQGKRIILEEKLFFFIAQSEKMGFGLSDLVFTV